MEEIENPSEENSERIEECHENSDEKLEKICDILDKLTLDTLFLMEKEIELKMNLESSMCNGESHLAKARYIMGQNSVSSLQLPTENSPEFSAALKVNSVKNELLNGKSYDLIAMKKSEDENIIDPLRWFGLLVPQNMNHAQSMFRQALQWTVQAVKVQSQLMDTMKLICGLRMLKAQHNDELIS